MKILYKITFCLFFISFFAVAQRPQNCNGCDPAERKCLVQGGGGLPKPHKNPILAIGLAVNRGVTSNQYYLKYSNISPLNSSTNLKYQKLELPLIMMWNPTKNISLGGGLQGDVLLGATEAGKTLNINNREFKKFGGGINFGVEVGAKDRGPRLAVNYIQHFGAGSVKAKSYGTLEFSLQVQIGKKFK